MLFFYDLILLIILVRVFVKSSKIIEITDSESNVFPDYKLPIVTILLPLYKEKRTLQYLLESILQSNYPKSKLDIRFLIEHDDTETLRSILSLSDNWNRIEEIEFNKYGIPKKIKVLDKASIEIDYIFKGVRTKPNALNVGLKNAKGDMLIIYDAEDRPNPNEMRKMAKYMMENPEIACVQARLSYYNADQSLLTKLFTIEYIQHFLVMLPEYFSMKHIIPLGGTSNFFRVEVLRDLNGWDPMNVTEDADLGIRLARRGYLTVPMNVITWEEAPPGIYYWIRQRVRWNKGYLYTLVRLFRHPLQLMRDVGFKSTISIVHLLSYPIISIITLVGWVFFSLYWLDWFGIVAVQPLADWIHEAFESSPPLFYMSLLTLAFGVFYNTFVGLEGLFRQQDGYALGKVKYIFFTPLYLLLHGISAVIATVELVLKPNVWHKTPHGFSIKDVK